MCKYQLPIGRPAQVFLQTENSDTVTCSSQTIVNKQFSEVAEVTFPLARN